MLERIRRKPFFSYIKLEIKDKTLRAIERAMYNTEHISRSRSKFTGASEHINEKSSSFIEP